MKMWSKCQEFVVINVGRGASDSEVRMMFWEYDEVKKVSSDLM